MEALWVTAGLSIAAGVVVSSVWRWVGPARKGTVAVRVGDRYRETRLRRFLRSRLTPGEATGLALTITVLAVGLTGLLVGILAFWIRRKAPFISFDESVERWAEAVATHTSDAVLNSITWLGAIVTVIATGLVLAIWARVRHRTWAPFGFLTLVIAGQAVIVTLIKIGVERVRPALAPRAVFSGPAFPSGHSTTAAACLLALSLVASYGAGPRARRWSAAVAVGLAVAVACSRVLLGVHWFSDALAGLAIGWTWYAVCSVMFGGSLLRFGLPARVAERGLAPSSGASERRTRGAAREVAYPETASTGSSTRTTPDRSTSA